MVVVVVVGKRPLRAAFFSFSPFDSLFIREKQNALLA